MAWKDIKPQLCTLNTVVWFGKHKGMTFGDMIDEDPNYAKWVYDQFENGFLQDRIMDQELEQEFMDCLESEGDSGWGKHW